MKTHQIRTKFLTFFGDHQHVIKDSFSLIPSDDPTLLFTSAGMAPFKPYFLGIKTDMKRATTCQKCSRTTDIENVGYTARHHTFFEMLGNFSFGDYFKKEAIAWAWEFVTREIGLPKDKLFVSIHHSDEEAFEIWNKAIGVPAERIVRLGDKDNFWTIGVGPSGPCSEIYIDQGPELSCGKKDCAPGCDCPRYLEFWNLVFTQYNRSEDGKLTPLEKKNIDTGMGLERLAAIVQGKKDNFENDLFQGIVKKIEEISGRSFYESPQVKTAIKVISDHVRALSFAISDGAFPGNEGRGYVLRKLLRRAARFGYRYLGREEPFLFSIVPTVAKVMDCYPDLARNIDHVAKVIRGEEERFLVTLKTGTEILNDFIRNLKRQNMDTLDGSKAFLLHDTYGFPLDLTKEICREEKVKIDEKGFEVELEKQRERGRANLVTGFTAGSGFTINAADFLPTRFSGYETCTDFGKVLKIIDGEKNTYVVTDISPFYGTSGGQVGDMGTISKGEAVFIVETTERNDHVIVHIGKWKNSRRFSEGDSVNLEVDRNSRRATMRNHTATHLLHKALRDKLGNHVKQAGSLVAPERLRFDFSHYEAIPAEVLEEIEKTVNEKVLAAIPVKVESRSFDEAVREGAMALFGEKYGDVVRVVSVGDYSRELCGGTHISNTSEIGLFSLVSETSIAAGVRRIEAVTGEAVLQRMKAFEAEVDRISAVLECEPKSVFEKINRLVSENHSLKRDLESFKMKELKDKLSEIRAKARELAGITAIIQRVDGLGVDEMKKLTDDLIANNSKTLALLASAGEKVNFVLKISKDLVENGLNAGKIIKDIAKIAGGGGGGRPDMATAGGKYVAKIDEAVQAVENLIIQSLKK